MKSVKGEMPSVKLTEGFADRSILAHNKRNKTLHIIETKEQQAPAARESRRKMILRKVGIAAITTLLVYFVFVYLNTGIVLLIPRKHWDIAAIEIGLAFIFLLLIFYSHTRISKLSRSAAFQRMPPFVRGLLEGLLVVVITVILDFLVSGVPLIIIYDQPLRPDRLRTSFVVGSIISLFFYYFVERERNKKLLQAELLRSEQLQKENFRAQLDSLKNQMNPHFLFNSLNVLNSLIFVNRQKAADFTRQLSDVYRSFLDNSSKTLVPLKDESELISSYSALLLTRFGENLKIETRMDKRMMQRQIPPGSLQMLLENAIKHNGFSAKKPLCIEVYTENDHVVVRNNLQPRKDEIRSTGHGLKNIKSRYHYLSDKEVAVTKTSKEFIVKIPLLKPESNADSDH